MSKESSPPPLFGDVAPSNAPLRRPKREASGDTLGEPSGEAAGDEARPFLSVFDFGGGLGSGASKSTDSLSASNPKLADRSSAGFGNCALTERRFPDDVESPEEGAFSPLFLLLELLPRRLLEFFSSKSPFRMASKSLDKAALPPPLPPPLRPGGVAMSKSLSLSAGEAKRDRPLPNGGPPNIFLLIVALLTDENSSTRRSVNRRCTSKR